MGALRATLIAIGMLLFWGSAHPSVGSPLVWDYSPELWGIPDFGIFLNHSSGQNFAERVLFPQFIAIDGIDIYGSAQSAGLGTATTVRIWRDDSGRPGAILTEFSSLINLVDSSGATTSTVRKHADFSMPFVLEPNLPYWIGMSATDTGNPIVDITQAMLAKIPPGGDGLTANFNYQTFDFLQRNGDMALRLYGTQVPEPPSGTLWMVNLTFVAFLSAVRRRHNSRPRRRPHAQAAEKTALDFAKETKSKHRERYLELLSGARDDAQGLGK
jgi:hypothetical protein